MRKCFCESPHKQVTISKAVTHNKVLHDSPAKVIIEKGTYIPKECKKAIKDYPAIWGVSAKKEAPVKKPWHRVSEMTKWEFVNKKENMPNKAKYTAEFPVPHPYFEYTAEVYEKIREKNEMEKDPEMQAVERYFSKSNFEKNAEIN